MTRTVITLIALLAVLLPAIAQKQPSGAPGVVTGGSGDVSVEGKPASRAGDTTSDGKIVQGSSNVFINGKPAVVMGGSTDCGGATITGSRGVFINGKPMARSGDSTPGCAAR